jgi:hypothetical protein
MPSHEEGGFTTPPESLLKFTRGREGECLPCSDARAWGTSVDGDAYWRCVLACPTEDCRETCATDHVAGAATFATFNADYAGVCSGPCAYGTIGPAWDMWTGRWSSPRLGSIRSSSVTSAPPWTREFPDSTSRSVPPSARAVRFPVRSSPKAERTMPEWSPCRYLR